MNRVLEDRKLNKKKVFIVILIAVLFIILVSVLIYRYNENKWNNIDVSNAVHAVIVDDVTSFYRKPMKTKFRHISDLEFGEYVYIVEEYISEDGQEWYKVKCKDKVGFIDKKSAKFYEYINEDGRVLMSDVSKFNVIYKHFETSGDYAAFLLKYGVNYAYIRLGGRGYGDEGKFYTDPNYQMFIEACDYLKMPYGFYYIDEAITDEELDEEVIFVQEFLNKNKTQMNILPLAIDAEYHDGVGRADEMWDERAELLSNLILKFKEKGIDTIVYSNANTAAEYLDELDTKLWIAYYDKKGEIPNHWYSETDQEAALNEEFTNKIIAWQFTETGIDRNSKFQVDFSIVDNRFFKQFVR